MRRRATGTAIAVALVLGTVAAGCSSGGDDGGAGTTTTAAPTSTTSAAPTTTLPAPLDDQAPPVSINGLTVQGDTLWIASIKGDELLRVRRSDGAILARYDTHGAGPDDVAIAPDGSVWSTGFANGDVGHVVDGRYEVATTLKAGINPLEFGPDGQLYVGTYGPDGKLFQIDPAYPKPVISLGAGLPDINAFGILADGTLVAPAGGIAGPGSAVAITVHHPCTEADGCTTISTVVDGLPPVAAGATDAEGDAYVLANVTGEVIRVDVAKTTSTVVRTVKEGAPFDNLAFAPDGTLYLSSFTAAAVTEVEPDGTTRVIPIGKAS
jgi:streptogramin lyase